MQEEYKIKDIIAEPDTIEGLNIPQSIVIDIILRLLFNEGNVSFSRFAEVLKVHNRIIDSILMWMQKEHLADVSKGTAEIGRFGYVFTLTDAGKERARDALERSQYVGPVPVSVPSYIQGIEIQTSGKRQISSAQVIDALKLLILPTNFHRYIGPAINSCSSLFLYGPPGNGKTTIAQAAASLIAGTSPIWLPYSITAGGQIIQIFDRHIHKPISIESGRTAEFGRFDKRWGLFKRPSVMVGGELKMDALDLRFDPVSKIYEAPLQMKANGGLLLIDDFGRQQIRPVDLFNRWIVPLESQVDIIRLHSGQSIVVPFRLLLVFSTNLNPHDLVDDAFLRRIQMKVNITPPDDKLFYQIFIMECKHLGIEFNKDAYLHLIQNWYKQQNRPFQAVQPRDILKTVMALCEYEGIPPQLSPELIDEACLIYFVK
ncbi:MAG: ATP-binding protein [Chloroflexi bacterium]|nr:ATP-binding protein [Chloroflexota bacterium]